jgi:haloalkane dehalogenase
MVRTPEDRTSGLPGFPFESRYETFGDVRIAHLDEGEGKPVVFSHGEPTWSYLWREVLVPVRDAGYRCIAPDYAGFGRSDKPIDPAWHTYDRHVDLMTALVGELDLRDATAVVHDWGGPIGLRVAIENPDRFSRIAIMDSGPFTGHQRMSPKWAEFRDFVEATPDLPVGSIIRANCESDPGDEVIAAYDAPYPDAASKAGARALPLLIPLAPDAPGAAAGRRLAEGLRAYDGPSLVLWGESDQLLPFSVGERVSSQLGLADARKIENAAHFLQEDAGPEIGAIIADWLG